ncbi:MAG TPA: universal stress protein [Acidobacteriaceae bacterium]|nr:universal stress protein [Acidobacteriaceae bacterium]
MTAPFAEDRPLGIREILFATDFSEVSAAALPYAAAPARHLGARLWGTHVIPVSEYAHREPAERRTALREMRAEAENGVSRLPAAGHYRGIEHGVVLERGEILPALARAAGAELMVPGMHGRHGIEKMLPGSWRKRFCGWRYCRCWWWDRR